MLTRLVPLTIVLAVLTSPLSAQQATDSGSTAGVAGVPDSTGTVRAPRIETFRPSRLDTVLAETADSTSDTLDLRNQATAEASDTGGSRRPHAIEYSEGYATRLTIHRIASYAELPLFAGEYIVGQRLLNDERTMPRPPGGLRSAHRVLATSLDVLFLGNTVTGVWNLVSSWHDPNGRTRRLIHAVTMLAADAGFAYTGSLAHDARRTDAGANKHRNFAIASISLASASTLMMWFWK
jgi:hypothetical protein